MRYNYDQRTEDAFMLRWATVFLILAMPGCSARQPPSVQHVDLAELEAATKHLVFFNYTGNDSQFHYFRTKDGSRYKLDRSTWNMPLAFPVDGGAELYVTVRDGQIALPDPQKMSGLHEGELMGHQE